MDRKLICSHCLKSFSNISPFVFYMSQRLPVLQKSNLLKHVKNGVCKNNKHKCPVCTASFTQKSLLVDHLTKIHPSQSPHLLPDHKCDKCNQVLPEEFQLRRHIETCTKRKFPCPVCRRSFCLNKTMIRHLRARHPEQAPAKKPHRLNDVEGYKCCGETFANGREYRTHKDRVHVRKPIQDRTPSFSCQRCDTQFCTKVELIQHSKCHRPDKQSETESEDEEPRYYKCPYKQCNERFQNRSDFVVHKRTHWKPIEEDVIITNEGRCEVCEEWFWTQRELEEHRMDEHGLTDSSSAICFQCPFIGCNRTFDTRIDQFKHKEDEHNESTTEGEVGEEENEYGLIDNELFDDFESLLESTKAKSLYTKVGDNVVDRAGQKKFKTTRSRSSFQLTSKALRLCEKGLSLEVLSKVLESMFKNSVSKGGYIQIKLLAESLDTPIVMPLIHVKLFDPLVLLNYIESVMSSKDQLALDETLTFDVIHVEDTSGAGKIDAPLLDSYLKRRAGTFDARNWDYRCLGLCLAASIMIKEKDNFLQAKFYKDPQHCVRLQTLTDELYRKAGVDPDKECGELELRKFQVLFNEEHGRQIVVLNENLEHQFTGDPVREGDDQLFLLLFNKHFYLIWDLDGFIGRRKRFCRRCIAVYDARSHHLCNDVCPQCRRVNCEAMEDPDTIIVCDRCNITFVNFQCYLAHIGSQRMCMHVRYRCPTCLSIREAQGYHRCDRKPKCRHCFEEVDLAEHLCQVQVPSEQTRLGSKKFNVIYFDIETSTNEEGILIPYLVCWAINCESCIDEETEHCQICGDRYRHNFGWDSSRNFCDWLVTNKRIEKYRTILTAHNSAKFDAYFIYDYAAQTGSKPNLNFRANDLLSFTWKKIQLKDSLQFMKCSLKKLPTILGLDGVEKGFFALFLAKRVGLNYRGKMPPPSDFGIHQMSDEEKVAFWEWYTPLERDPEFIYDLRVEAIKYCNMDVKILEAAWKQFRNSCLKLTDGKVDPLIGRYFTLASFSAAIYKTLFMNHPIGIVPYGGYRNPKRASQSWQGSAYLDFLNHQRAMNNQEPLVCANNSVDEVRIGPYKVDGFCRQTGDIYEILGCLIHGHCGKPDDCLWNLQKTVHPIRKPLTFEDVNLQTMTRLNQLSNTGRTVRIKWICDIVKEMTINPLLNAFMNDENMQSRYKKPLEPSLAIFGGRVEAFKTRLTLTTDQIMNGYTIEYVDFCSLYPFVQWMFEFTTNAHPNVIVERARLDELLNRLSEFLDANYGLCYCSVLPPNRINFAVLPYRTRDKTVFCLCRTCAEKDMSEGCEHSDAERALEGVYTFYELNKALQRGYVVSHIFEIWNYGPEKAKIMADYVTRMIAMKTRHSEVPSNMTVQEFSDLWNERVPGLGLKPEDFVQSPAMRLSAKILMNSLWGKFCERASKTYTCLIDSWYSLKHKLNDKEIIVSRIEQISGRSLVISYQKKQPFLNETSMYNPVLGSHVTAYARTVLLERCLEVVGDRAIYTDTDSLVYLRIPGAPEPVRGDALGQLANELKNDEFGTCFQCVAPKTWRMEVSKRTCDAPLVWRPDKTIMKSKGLHLLSLGSSIKKSIDDRDLWNDLIDMRLITRDRTAPRRSIAEFYKSLEGYQIPGELINPCLQAFTQQKWITGRSDKKASGLIVPQPKLTRDRFSGMLKDERFARKMLRLRHDKSILLNTEENWPQNRSSTKPYGFRFII